MKLSKEKFAPTGEFKLKLLENRGDSPNTSMNLQRCHVEDKRIINTQGERDTDHTSSTALPLPLILLHIQIISFLKPSFPEKKRTSNKYHNG